MLSTIINLEVNILKEILTHSAKLWGKIMISTIMAFFVILSTTLIFTTLFTENLGYSIYSVDKDGKRQEKLYTYYYADGEDNQIEQLKKDEVEFQTEYIRSDLGLGGSIVYAVISQIICLAVLVAFVYSQLSKLGKADNTNVNYKGYAEDKLKGLKIGFVTAAPFIIFYLVHIVFALGVKPDFSMAYYRIVNYIFYPVLNFVIGNANVTVGDLSPLDFVLAFLPLLVVPVAAHFSYIIGYKKIEFFDRLIYKNSEKGKV